MHDVLLGRFRQMAANFSEKPWRGDECESAAIAVSSGNSDAFSKLARELFDGVLLVTTSSLQARPSLACATSAAGGSHHDASRRISPQIAIMSSRERILQGFERTRGRARLAQFEYGGMPRIGDENCIATHCDDLRIEGF